MLVCSMRNKYGVGSSCAQASVDANATSNNFRIEKQLTDSGGEMDAAEEILRGLL
jgi:hypothetical protein